MKKTIKFEIELDDNYLPINIEMDTSDSSNKEDKIKALMLSAWSSNSNETLHLPLWTKDMPVTHMLIMYYQTMLAMSNSLVKATGNDELANSVKDYCEIFAQKAELKKLK
tara:strand:- start:1107 stop:1436 length:330 start_codon:yes stop_codon:yes gene_type:complete